ncbi:sensor histidine kinase [Lutibacter holmesii]|uniref:Sensor histidine kinase n=1 Tax=Lutibacter holmesii TaxID=1137985 RepID=A0ABW3WKB2_9FLAO
MLLDFHSEVYSWIRGGVFILFVYHLLIYFQNKNNLYLFYSLYLLFITLFLCQSFIEDLIPGYSNYANFSMQFLAYGSYIAFARELLDSRNKLLMWDKYFEIEIKVLLLLAPVFLLIQFFFGYDFQVKAFIVLAPVITLFTFYIFYVIITRINNSATINFVIATLFYVVFANISFLELVFGKDIFISSGVKPIFFIYVGVLFQCLILSVIIGSIIKKIEQKSKNAEVSLAVKLKEMEELKMTALQSQMNPHFLFNSLNSINNFVIKSEVEKASDYITKFSRLIRVILNSSSSPTSTLSEELGILSLYVKLEQMRVNGGFSYTVNIQENINLEAIKVPTLFLQPFIENSIWHGIMKKEGKKKIELSIQKQDNTVICIIEDNGIGINKAKSINHMSQKRKFFGAKATENRIRILYKNKDVHIETKDISSSTKTGTQVSIKFPFE